MLSHSDLLNGKLSEFTITSKDEEPCFPCLDENDEEEDDDVYDESRDIAMDTDLDLPFDQMKKAMDLIHLGIYKKILSPGTGDLVPETARVSIDYSGFWEGNSTPFESSWVNRRPRMQKMGEDMLPGVYHALQSMRLGEVAKFIVPYTLLYGALGCEVSGIPQKADGLYIIRLIAFQDIGDSDAITDKNIDDYDTYHKVLERVADVRKSGRANFAEKNYQEAIKDFKKCISALRFCRGADEEERRVLLEQLYVNVCVCYNKLERPMEVLKMRDELSKCLKTNSKAMFQFARAHATLSNYTEALQYLRWAQNLEPNNKEIASELKAVTELNEAYKKDIKEISKKAMQTNKDTAKEGLKADVKNSSIYKMLEAFVKGFVDDADKKSELLPINLSAEELQMVGEIANSYNLAMEQKTVNEEQWTYLFK